MKKWLDRAIPLAGGAFLAYGLLTDTMSALRGIIWGGLSAIVVWWLIGLIPRTPPPSSPTGS